MTDRQRDEIRKMRLNGLGYNMIAGLLNLGENNVYAYCKSHGLAGASDLLERNNEEAKQENANKNPIINSTLRDYMAGEVSKDICRRFLFPEDVIAAHDDGIIHTEKNP